MKSVLLLQIYFITTCSNIPSNGVRLNNIINTLYSRRSFSERRCHRRALSRIPATLYRKRLQSRNRCAEISQSCSVPGLPKPFVLANMLEQHRYRGLQDPTISLDAVLASSPDMSTNERTSYETSRESGQSVQDTPASSMDSPRHSSETFETRPARSISSGSRNSNRLSLTLPIAPPDGAPSRPTPTPTSSVPPTPVETSALNSPMDPNDIIIAIAAQERRVLELREELGQAEGDLRKLKKQWANSEAYRKRANRNIEPIRTMMPGVDGQPGNDNRPTSEHSSELERRKAILLAQSQASPREHKRTVFKGGHTRTLSLLSPIRPSADTAAHRDKDVLRSPDLYSKPSPLPSPVINKRATWAPRQSQPPHGMKQIANDFKQGLWTFVEDLRQATVGDEAISGTTNRTSDMVSRSSRMESDQDTIRASMTNRGRIPFPTDPDSRADTPNNSSTGSSNDHYQHRRTTSRPEAKARKHFSWTPLTFDSFDDEAWSNWESPNVKTSRWSGSTVNGDIVTAIPERTDENEGTLRKRSRSELRSSSPEPPSKLEELPQAILNRLSSVNLKNTTSNFIKEWEKSLSPPPESTSFDTSSQDTKAKVP
ncbi:hypothetical protein F4779DRAFT_247428 [Xylariaceae sp. FL0662B]|nr:hypothetical protein F4779DRAFT_247428 [Xylariaceae sp. FL0662B]